MLKVPPYTLRLLGPPGLHRSGQVLDGPVAHRHRLALLALLALAPGGVRSREHLIGMLWPEMDAARARHLLNVAVHEIRRAIGDAILVSQGQALRLEVGAMQVDALAFERSLDHGDPSAAVALYTGEFLEGLALPGAVEFEHWQQRLAVRYAQLYATALERLAKRAEMAGDRSDAVQRWRERAARSPEVARVTLHLMKALAADGDRAGALRVAQEHAQVLAHEYGIEPDAEVQALASRLAGRRWPPAGHDAADARSEHRRRVT